MGVYLGGYKNTSAAKCALKINWGFLNIIKPKFEASYEALRNGTYRVAHAVGIDTSEVLVVRAGIRDNNDLVWIGRSPNVAAKLSGQRESPYHSFITADVFNCLNAEAKTGGSGNQPIWEQRSLPGLPGSSIVYRSHWTWEP